MSVILGYTMAYIIIVLYVSYGYKIWDIPITAIFLLAFTELYIMI